MCQGTGSDNTPGSWGFSTASLAQSQATSALEKGAISHENKEDAAKIYVVFRRESRFWIFIERGKGARLLPLSVNILG